MNQMQPADSWRVAILDACIVCGAVIDRSKNKRLRSYCGEDCRIKCNRQKIIDSGYNMEYQRKRTAEKAKIADPLKKKCAICGLYFRRVCHHVRQAHGISAREYKQNLDVPTKKGILSEELRQVIRDHTKSNGTINNLFTSNAIGARLKPGDNRIKSFPRNKWGCKKVESNEYYE